MNNKSNFILVIIILSILYMTSIINTSSSTPSAPSLVTVAWVSLTDPQNVTSGDYDVPLYIVLSGNNVVGASLLSFTYAPFGAPYKDFKPVIAYLPQETVLEFIVSIPSNVEAGLYYPCLSVNYTYDNSVYTENIPVGIYISPVIFPLVSFQWGTYNSIEFVSPGEGLAPLTVIVQNPSNKLMSDVKISLYLPKGLLSQEGNSIVNFTVASVEPLTSYYSTQYVNVTPYVKPGSYTVNYTVSFIDELGGYHSFTYNNGSIFIYPNQPLKVYVNSTSITPGIITPLLVYLKSYGVQLTSISLSSPEPISVVGSNITTPISFTGLLPVEFELFVPNETSPGVYPVNIYGTYIYAGQEYQFSLPAYLKVGIQGEGPEVVSINWINPPYPGSIASAYVTIFNPLPYEIFSVNISLANSTFTTLQPYYIIPQILPTSSAQIEVTFSIPSVKLLSNYKLSFLINYYSSYGKSSTISCILTTVYGKPLISVKVSPTYLVEGQQSYLVVNVTNLSPQPLYDISIKPDFNTIEILSYENQTVNQLSSGNYSLYIFSVYIPPNIPTGVYPINILVSYTSLGTESFQTFTLPLNIIENNQQLLVSINHDVIYYDYYNNITFTIYNNANYTISNLLVKIYTNPDLLSISENQFTVDQLLPNESTEINIIAYSPLSTSQIVPLLLTVQFNTPKGIISYSQNFSLVLTGFIKINVLDPSVIYDNGSLVFEATLLNTGNTQANNLILYYPGGSEYIGQLPVNSPIPVSIVIRSSSSTYVNSSNITVPLLLSYENPSFQTFNQSYIYTGPITVVPSIHLSEHNPIINYIILSVGIVLGAAISTLALLKFRKSKESEVEEGEEDESY